VNCVNNTQKCALNGMKKCKLSGTNFFHATAHKGGSVCLFTFVLVFF